jgi:sec-independent protein translocase protein TatA
MVTLPSILAFIDGLGGPEMLVILLLSLVLFGGENCPDSSPASLGKTMREFKKAASNVEEEFKRALDEDERKTNQALYTPPTPTVTPLPVRCRATTQTRPDTGTMSIRIRATSRIPGPGRPLLRRRSRRQPARPACRRLPLRPRRDDSAVRRLDPATTRGEAGGGRSYLGPHAAARVSAVDESDPVRLPITGELDLHTFGQRTSDN